MGRIEVPGGQPLKCTNHIPVPIEFTHKADDLGNDILIASRIFCFSCGLTMGIKADFYDQLNATDPEE